MSLNAWAMLEQGIWKRSLGIFSQNIRISERQGRINKAEQFTCSIDLKLSLNADSSKLVNN